jgi:hypothetical protein
MRVNITIKKIQDNQAILKDEKGRLIDWPADLLSAGAKEGEKIAFSIGEESDLAKNILNEILNTD